MESRNLVIAATAFFAASPMTAIPKILTMRLKGSRRRDCTRAFVIKPSFRALIPVQIVQTIEFRSSGLVKAYPLSPLMIFKASSLSTNAASYSGLALSIGRGSQLRYSSKIFESGFC
jgi:hypothetical protein